MKRILTILAILVSMVCGSAFLVSCSDGYKKMYLEVEYAVYDDAGKFNRWETVKGGNLDYTMSSNLYSNEFGAYVLNLRVNVKGTSKKVSSVYVAQSATTAVSFQNKNVKPNETFTVLVHNIGSVSFNLTPSHGGDDKAAAFKLNVYRSLTGIEQNVNCVPAVVEGGNIKLNSLSNLIKYYPFDEEAGVTQTNQTGVDFRLEAVGKLVNTGTQTLLEREFVASSYGSPTADGSKLIGETGIPVVELLPGKDLLLQIAADKDYNLTSENNVIKLTAVSKHDKTKTATIYAFIVENFRNSDSLLLSYKNDILLTPEGNLPTTDVNPVGEEVIIYDALLDSPYKAINVFTYTSRSIYSFVSEPGISLKVYINGVLYNYAEVTESNIGIKVTPVETSAVNSVGLRIETNPLKMDEASEYNIKLELDFTAFDFSASDTAPVEHLHKSFKVKVKSLASAFSINGKSYSDNLNDGDNEGSYITKYNSNEISTIYSEYAEGALGMPLNIKAVPLSAVDSKVEVSFYKNSIKYNKETGIFTGEGGSSINDNVVLSETANSSLLPTKGQFEFTKAYANRQVYFSFARYDSTIKTVYMVCRAKCTPDKYNGVDVEPKYITFIAKFDVVGSAGSVELYQSANGANMNKLEYQYLKNGASNVGYIGLDTNATDINLASILVSATNAIGTNVKFSADGINWDSSITMDKLTKEDDRYKLFFKSGEVGKATIKVSAPNNLNFAREFEFVNVTTVGNVDIEYDNTYITTWTSSDEKDKLYYYKNGANQQISVKYLALQDGATVQFVAKGNGRDANVKAVNATNLMTSMDEYNTLIRNGENKAYYPDIAMTTFSSSAIKLKEYQGSNFFEISANTISFTSILFVEVQFYVQGINGIELESKYFLYEIAVYVPAKDLDVTLSNESIVYVNDHYIEAATTEITVNNNISATSRIAFSSNTINESKIYAKYGEADRKSIYGISVNVGLEAFNGIDLGEDDEGNALTVNDYISVEGLETGVDNKQFVLSSRKFTIQAKRDLKSVMGQNVKSLYIDFVVYQFGDETIHTVRKIVYFGDYTKADGIVISGVDSYSNIYMSLWGAAEVTKQITASVTNDATYKDLGYKLEQVQVVNGQIVKDNDGNIVTGEVDDPNNLIVNPPVENNEFNITAKNKGGIYLLTIYAVDSYSNDERRYTVSENVLITVSDGTSEATAYLITKYEEFVKIDPSADKWYRLASDNIDLSPLNDEGQLAKWWNLDRDFNGHLDGAMTIYNANNGDSITKRFPLKNLTIPTEAGKKGNFGLFSTLTTTATVKNVIFENVGISVELDGNNTSYGVNIGVVAGVNYGVIENCSVKLINSSVTLLKKTEVDAGGSPVDKSALGVIYNIGILTGQNAKQIAYDNTKSSDYAYMLDCASQGALKVVVEANNVYLPNAKLYIGGIAGNNASAGTISATYADLSDQSLRTLITGVVNIELQNKYDNSQAPVVISSVAVGGAVGYNQGSINKVAMSGKLVANDNVNMGGVVGINANKVYECANYGMVLKGYSYNDTLDDAQKYKLKTLLYNGAVKDADKEILLEQNIGGIIGYNSGTVKVENVRTMFMTFEAGYVSVSSAESYIEGLGNIAGIIGNAEKSVVLVRANVENFILNATDKNGKTIREYSIIGAEGYNANIAGLVAKSSAAKAYLSFVQADFNVGKGEFYEFGKGLTFDYTYFIGDVLAHADKLTSNKLTTHQSISGENSYIINNVIYTDGGEEKVNIDSTKGTITIGGTGAVLTGVKMGDTETEYTVKWGKGETDNDYNGVNDNNPYLIYVEGGEARHTLTVEPTSIIVNVDKDFYHGTEVLDKVEFVRYIEGKDNASESGIYMQYLADAEADPDVYKATAVVYYNKNGNNTHKLITETIDGTQVPGLIQKSIVPVIATGTYTVTITSGSTIATLLDGDKSIKFEDVGKVVLKFTSLFNSEIEDSVVIFVENALHDDTLNVSTSSGIVTSEDEDGNLLYATSVGNNPKISIGLKDIDGETFDSTKLYMNYTVGNVGNATIDANKSNYFTFSALTQSIGTNKYLLGDLQLEAKDLPDSVGYVVVPLTINIYLNLDKYEIGAQKLSNMMSGANPILATKVVNITIYNKATQLTLSSDVKTEAGTGVDVVANLITGYINADKGNPGYSPDDTYNYRLQTEVVNQDYVIADLTAANANAVELLEEIIKPANNWDIFDIFITYKTIQKNGGNVGYEYTFNLSLKLEYRKLLTLENRDSNEWKFNIQMTASSNNELSQNVVLTFVPQPLTTFRIENYAYLVSKTGADNTSVEAEFVSNETESAMIVPGESGLLKIYAESNYAYFDNIKITSSTTIVDGQEYFVRFQQMVYDRANKVYRSLSGVTADGSSLGLQRKTYYNANGQDEYDGVIFVRTILENIVGVRKTFTFTVTADTYDINSNSVEISREKLVLSQYKPGVYISVENGLEAIDEQGNQVYLVEKGSDNVVVVARVYGYEFNVEPTQTKTYLDNGLNATDVVLSQSAIEQADDGAFIVRYNLNVRTNKAFKMVLTMQLIENGSTLVGKSSALTFYPVPYIPKSVHVRGEANGSLNININSSSALDLVWKTVALNNSESNSEDINEQIMFTDSGTPVLDKNYLEMFYFMPFNSSGQLYKQTLADLVRKPDKAKEFGFEIEESNDKYYIRARSKNSITMHFDAYYKYVLDKTATGSKIEFTHKVPDGATGYKKISHQFQLNLVVKSEENAPKPIATAQELSEMGAGEHYILTSDITVNNWTPITAEIGSLDGNGKTIKINSFNVAVAATTNVGLFATIGTNSIIKNVAIDISGLKTVYIKDENVATSVSAYFGVLAAINNGLVYNCEIISVAQNANVVFDIGTGYKFTFGGMVAQNNGNITNSRVGTEYFKRLWVDDGGVASRYSIVSCGTINFKARGIMAGFVGQNSATSIISSCYVANTSIENTSNAGIENNKTAGFAANNAGTIAYSYSKGAESSILVTRARATGCKVYSSGMGSVAGFVFTNTGTVHDCYSNIICESASAVAAGFVYDASQGSVYQCYSASEVIAEEQEGMATRLPFVGIGVETDNAKQLLSNENMVNCYYLDDGKVEYDYNYIVPAKAVEPQDLDLEAFGQSKNLNDFAFIDNGPQEQRLNAVWTYSTAIDENKGVFSLGTTSLPELTSANNIARSLRENTIDVYGYLQPNNYANGYKQGTKTNPYIIRSVEEYDSVFISNPDAEVKSGTGYIRFVNHISFKSSATDYIDISTRSNYTLGDADINTRELTVVDGNGMTISDVIINFTENDRGALGLFSTVEYALIKGLTVEYGDGAGDTKAHAVGGIAGIANDTYFIDITVDGKGNELRAHNVIGGVVGVLAGDYSGIYNINSNISVGAGSETSSRWSNHAAYIQAVKTVEEHNKTSETQMDVAMAAYAGGIAGVVDGSGNIKYLNKLTVDEAAVRGGVSGGIAGHLGTNAQATRLTYYIPLTNPISDSEETATIMGSLTAGGVMGEMQKSTVKYSQATMKLQQQAQYDKVFADYINSSDEVTAASGYLVNTNNAFGNLNAVASNRIAGGFVGYNFGGIIQDCMTKANIGPGTTFNNANTIGGFVGRAAGGEYRNVYAQNYIDLDMDTVDVDNPDTPRNEETTYLTSQNVGGFAGVMAHGLTDKAPGSTQTQSIVINDVVIMTFYDKAQLWDIADTTRETPDIDYIVGNKTAGIELISSTGEIGTKPIINYGKIKINKMTSVEILDENGNGTGKYENKVAPVEVVDTKLDNIQYIEDMRELYNLESDKQKATFESLFISWDTNYWDLDNTKFMPNLHNANTALFIEISGEEDLDEFARNPNGNFILMDSITLTKDYYNYVADIDFTGTLIGKLSASGLYPTFQGIKLNANASRSGGAGFFRQTTSARITNVNFEYDEIKLNGSGALIVGGVTSKDASSGRDGSRFENIKVTDKDKDLTVWGTAPVTALGSIVGEGDKSTITSCVGSLSYDVKPYSSDKTISNIGGLVGSLDGLYTDTDANANLFNGLISGSRYSGDIRIQAPTGAGMQVGGIVGYAHYTHIKSCSVFKPTDSGVVDSENLPINVTLLNNNNNKTNYFGGIIGNATEASVTHSGALITLGANADDAAASYGTNANYTIGGTAASMANTQVEGSDVSNSYATMDVTIKNSRDAIIGGIVANVLQPNTQLAYNVASLKASTDNVNAVKLGGIIGRMGISDKNEEEKDDEPVVTSAISSNKKTIVNSIAYLQECDIKYGSNFVGGGLIGETSIEYVIDNSMSVGQLWANCAVGSDGQITATTATATIVGGMVGLVGSLSGISTTAATVSQTITNSYTALTISTANVFKGTTNNGTNDVVHNVYSKAIVGYTEALVTTSNVLYSSDYCLVFDNDSADTNLIEFSNAPINVSANILLDSSNTLRPNLSDVPTSGKIGDNWEFPADRLPTPLDTNELLNKATNDTAFAIGSAFNPYKVEDQSSWTGKEGYADTNYNYVTLVGTQIDMASVNFGDFRGVLLGNNLRVTLNNIGLFNELKLHSAVSNVVVTLSGECGGFGGIATTNNGTIFMCGVQYDNLSAEDGPFGGIAKINNGLISYCYNSGTLTGATNAGGLVCENGINSTIEYSYFTGNMTFNINTATIAYTNDGFISNCYSAGQAGSGFVSTISDSARHENNYFDYYATYVTQEAYDDEYSGITGISTTEIQKAEDAENNSNLLKGWKVYGMVSAGYRRDAVEDANRNPRDTFNYGYPIHYFNQYVNAGGETAGVSLIGNTKRVKFTGNGTFDGIEGVTDVAEAVELCKGYLVKDSDKDLDPDIEWYDNSSYLINNLGLLDYIRQLESGENPWGTSNKYFQLECNLDIGAVSEGSEEGLLYYFGGDKVKDIFNSWKGISNFQGVFSAVVPTKVAGETYYELDTTLFEAKYMEGTEEKSVSNVRILKGTPGTISNLRGGAMFASVSGSAVVTGMIMSGSTVTSAPLINDVVSDADSYIVAYNVGISDSVKAYGAGGISGLIYNVRGNLRLHSIKAEAVTFAGSNSGANNFAGLIGANSGTITLHNELVMEVTCNNYVENSSLAGFVGTNSENASINTLANVNITLSSAADSIKLSSASGFARENNGSIYGNGSVIRFDSGFVAGTISGIAANMSTDNSYVDGFDISTASAAGPAFEADVYGGIVGTFTGGTIGGEHGITVGLTSGKANVFGGVAGLLAKSPAATEGDDIDFDHYITKVSIGLSDGSEAELFVQHNGGSDGVSAGIVVGKSGASIEGLAYALTANNLILKVEQYASLGESSPITAGGVGGVIGYATDGNIKLTGQYPGNIVTLLGEGNVGGFIGRYQSLGEIPTGLAVTQDNGTADKIPWVYATQKYAIIQLYERFAAGGGDTATVANFGGIIGYYESSALIDKDEGYTVITNSNPVLTELVNAKYSTSNAGYHIQNVGGIAGRSDAIICNATNNEQIGPLIDDEPKNGGNCPIDSTTDIYRLNNVGGIVGLYTGAGSETTGLINSKDVYGMQSVGGLIGRYQSTSGTTEITITQQTSSIKVMGLINIGGSIGSAVNVSIKGFNISQQSNIIGVANVGGLIGYADILTVIPLIIEEEEVTSIINNNVKGNYNVGGFAGLVNQYKTNGGEITVGSSDVYSEANAIVCGTVFDYMHKGERRAYLPTNVGGVFGTLNNTGEQLNSSQSITSYILLTTDKDHHALSANGDEYDATTTLTVSNNSNYFAKNAFDRSAKVVKFATDLSAYYDDVDVTSTSGHDGGIGGFAGQLGDDAVFSESTGTYQTCTIVSASLGVNVGGIVGYVAKANINNLPKASSSEDTPLYVAGYMYIGGYIGKCGGFDADSQGEIDASQYVYVQQVPDIDDEGVVLSTEPSGLPNLRLVNGKYIGGVIGYSAGEVVGVELTGDSSHLKIYNDTGDSFNSQYVGVIAGRVDGVLTNCKVSPGVCGAKIDGTATIYTSATKGEDGAEDVYVTKEIDIYKRDGDGKSGVIQAYDTYNYGGLAGYCAVYEASDDSITILGEHYYPFTIDTLASAMFDELASEFVFDDTYNVLSAYAHYYNSADITISVSMLNSLYDGSDDYNPIFRVVSDKTETTYSDEYATVGWAHDYTMFRQMNRIEKQYSEPTGEYMQSVYSANNIKRVHAQSTVDAKGTSVETCVISDTVKTNKIVYTIYEPLNEKARLYCEYGVAELSENFDRDEKRRIMADYDQDGIQALQQHFRVYVDDTTYQWTDDWQSSQVITDRNAFWAHVYDYSGWITSDQLTKVYPERGGDGVTTKEGWPAGYFPGSYAIDEWTDDDYEKVMDLQNTFGFTYYYPTIEGIYKDKDFVFTVVFGQLGYVDGDNIVREENTAAYSSSGSIFEVTGTPWEIAYEITDNEKWITTIIVAIIVIAAAVACVWGGGAAIASLSATAASIGAAATAAAKAIVLWKVFIVVAATIGVGGCGLLIQGIVGCSDVSQAYYSTLFETSQGYLHNVYSRDIDWIDGELDVYSDSLTFCLVTATALDEDGNAMNIAKKDFDGDDKVVYEFMVGEGYAGGKETCDLLLPYFECAPGTSLPSDYTDTEIVEAESLVDGDKGYGPILEELGVKYISIPKYRQADGIIYMYINSSNIVYSVLENYDTTTQLFEANGYDTRYLYNMDGYAYILVDNAESYEDYMFAGNLDDMKKFNISVPANFKITITEDVDAAITKDSSEAIMREVVAADGTVTYEPVTIGKGDIRWNLTDNTSWSEKKNYLYYQVKLKVAYGDDITIDWGDGYCLASADDTEGIKTAYLIPQVGGDGYTAAELKDLFNIDDSIPDSLYYVIDGNNDLNRFTIEAVYWLSNAWGVTNDSNGIIYEQGAFGELMPGDVTITLYKTSGDDYKAISVGYELLCKGWNKAFNAAGTGEDDFNEDDLEEYLKDLEAEGKLKEDFDKTFDELKEALEQWKIPFKECYLGEGAMYSIGELYDIQKVLIADANGKEPGDEGYVETINYRLVAKNVSKHLLAIPLDEDVDNDTIWVPCRTQMYDVDSEPSIDGRYVYNLKLTGEGGYIDSSGGYNAKFYTRYIYSNNWFDETAVEDSDPEDEEDDSVKVWDLFRPKKRTYITNNTFSEALRVSLSCTGDGKTVYTSYDQKNLTGGETTIGKINPTFETSND